MVSVARLEELFYRSKPDWIDGEALFQRVCRETIPPGSEIVEIGAGPSNAVSRFLATLGMVHGVDPDPDVKSNDALTTSHVMRDDLLPFPDESMDYCVSHYVVEHIGDPHLHLSEIRRVLKPGGAYIFRTPNRWHYVAFVASVTPHWFHVAVANRLRALPQGSHDPYPTRYAMNSFQSIRQHAALADFEVERLDAVEKEPSYGRFSSVAFLVLTGYERLLNATPLLETLRANFFAVLRKPA